MVADVVPLLPDCPHCEGRVDHEGGHDGIEAKCGDCGKDVVLVVFEDVARWLPVDSGEVEEE